MYPVCMRSARSACSGLHGANRLASNSLLECLVFGRAAAAHISRQTWDRITEEINVPHWDESQVTDSDEDVIIAHNWEELRRSMWDYVGIVRTDKRLQRALRRIDLLKQEVHEYYSHYRVSNDLIELRNLIHVAELIVRSALSRQESRGLHFNLDHPDTSTREPSTPSSFPATPIHWMCFSRWPAEWLLRSLASTDIFAVRMSAFQSTAETSSLIHLDTNVHVVEADYPPGIQQLRYLLWHRTA